jgi:hypothetical protein
MALGDELANLNFENLIGGPLSAVVKAQALAAKTSVDFIKAVGFLPPDPDDPDSTERPIMVTFQYDKPVEVKTGETTTIVPRTFQLSVPILAMLPIPFIRVEEATIDFNAKINSVQDSSTTTDLSIGSEFNSSFSAGAKWFKASADLKVTCSYKKSTSESQKVERTYSMAIHVRAVQDELPEGTARLLGILETLITEAPLPLSSPGG